MLTRVQICEAACDGLTDDELRLIAANGGFKQFIDTVEPFQRMQAIGQLAVEMPQKMAALKGNIVKLRPLLIQMLAEIEEMER